MLRDAATARGMTQERVADATTPHVHNSTKQQNTKQQKEGKKIGLGKIKRIWNAHEKPTADEMLRLCEALGLPKVRMLAELGMVAPESDREAYIDQLEEIASRITYTAGRVKVEQPHAAAVIAARRRRQPGDPQRPDHRSLASRRRA